MKTTIYTVFPNDPNEMPIDFETRYDAEEYLEMELDGKGIISATI